MEKLAIIGFGEAAMAFAGELAEHGIVQAFDMKTDRAETRDAKFADFARTSIAPAAQGNARHLAPGTLWFDMNSVAPDTKRLAAQAIEAVGGRYVDVAVMAPVHPSQMHIPLLLSDMLKQPELPTT